MSIPESPKGHVAGPVGTQVSVCFCLVLAILVIVCTDCCCSLCSFLILSKKNYLEMVLFCEVNNTL